MKLRPAGRLAVILAAAFGFGLIAACIKGNGPGIRDAVGNASAPWLLLPFAAGAAAGARRVTGGALTGLAATLAALAGFYLAESFVLDLGAHPWLTDLALTMRASLYWIGRACVSGPAFGALGHWWRQRRALTALGIMAAMFVLEPLAWLFYGQYTGAEPAYPVPADPGLWLTEIAVGIAGFAGFAVLARVSRPGGHLA